MPDRSKAIDRFVFLYALAWAGGTIAYVPLLTVLLPVRVETLAGKSAGVEWLAFIALAGAVAASIGGIVFGLLSDLTRNRRGWVFAGMLLSCGLLPVIGRATSLPEMLAGIVVWQLALNMMLGPLAAWAGDVVPDRRKGLLGGLMACAPGMGALAAALVTQPGLADGEQRLWVVALLVAICVLPVLLLGPTAANHTGIAGDAASNREVPRPVRALAGRMWLARLAVQVAEATLFAYLYFWLSDLDPSVTDNTTARLFSVIMLLSVPLALLAGRWSDRTDRPIAPLQAAAVASALGLAAMTLANDLPTAVAAYGLFGLSGAIFLALHSAQTLRILPQPARRGRDLGLFNLANTLPSMVMPWLAMALVPLFGFPALFLTLALLAGLAGLLLRGLTPTA